MSSLSQVLVRLCFVLYVGLSAASFLRAQDPSVAERLNRLEFNGYLLTSLSRSFGFYDPSRLGSVWIRCDEERAGLSVRDFDPERGEVTVALEGRTRTLQLKTPRVTPLPKAIHPEWRMQELRKMEEEAVYGNEELVRARMEIVVAREELESRRRSRAAALAERRARGSD